MMLSSPPLTRTVVVWTYRLLWLVAILLVLLMPLVIVQRGDVWLGPARFDAAHQLSHPTIVVGGPVAIQSGVYDPLVVILGSVEVSGPVGDDLVVVGGDVFLRPTAVIQGSLVDLLGQTYRAPGAVIAGTVGTSVRSWTAPAMGSPPAVVPLHRVDLVAQVRFGLAASVGLLLLCLTVAAVLPWSVIVTAAAARHNPIRSALAGLTGLVIVPLLMLPLTLSLVGVPLALALGGATFIVWLVGLDAAGLLVGRRLIRARRGRAAMFRVLIVGLAPMLLVLAIPVLGPIIVGAAGILGAGARMLSFVERERAVEALAALAEPAA
jgi:hypothetical protein